MSGSLNPKQEAFCKEYVIDLNATQAAIRAGYAEKTAYSQGQRLLKHVEVVSRLAEYAKKRCDEADISAKMVLDGIKAIAQKEDSRDGDRLKAYGLLGKYLKLFSDAKTIQLPDDCNFTMVVHGSKPDA